MSESQRFASSDALPKHEEVKKESRVEQLTSVVEGLATEEAQEDLHKQLLGLPPDPTAFSHDPMGMIETMRAREEYEKKAVVLMRGSVKPGEENSVGLGGADAGVNAVYRERWRYKEGNVDLGEMTVFTKSRRGQKRWSASGEVLAWDKTSQEYVSQGMEEDPGAVSYAQAMNAPFLRAGVDAALQDAIGRVELKTGKQLKGVSVDQLIDLKQGIGPRPDIALDQVPVREAAFHRFSMFALGEAGEQVPVTVVRTDHAGDDIVSVQEGIKSPDGGPPEFLGYSDLKRWANTDPSTWTEEERTKMVLAAFLDKATGQRDRHAENMTKDGRLIDNGLSFGVGHLLQPEYTIPFRDGMTDEEKQATTTQAEAFSDNVFGIRSVPYEMAMKHPSLRLPEGHPALQKVQERARELADDNSAEAKYLRAELVAIHKNETLAEIQFQDMKEEMAYMAKHGRPRTLPEKKYFAYTSDWYLQTRFPDEFEADRQQAA